MLLLQHVTTTYPHPVGIWQAKFPVRKMWEILGHHPVEHERDPGSANLKGSETNWNYAIAPKPSINLEKGSMSTPTFWFILVFLYFFNIYFLYFYNLIHYSSQGSASPRLIPAKQLTQQSVRIKYVRTCRELGRSVFVKNLVRSGFFYVFLRFFGGPKRVSVNVGVQHQIWP